MVTHSACIHTEGGRGYAHKKRETAHTASLAVWIVWFTLPSKGV